MRLPFFLSLVVCGASQAAEPALPGRCEVLPLPDDQVSFQIDGVEKARWHFGSRYPRAAIHARSSTPSTVRRARR
ncbi:MAG: hypothetical protein ACYTG0_19840 [Planctomycetota bacterium]